MPVLAEQPSHFHLIQLLLGNWALVLASATVFLLARSYFNRGLNRYPGPWLAKFTNAWGAWDVHKGDHHNTMIQLHQKYGPIVRVGPNKLDFSSVDYIPRIYGIRKLFPKSSLYNAFAGLNKGKRVHTVFSIRDETAHADMKRRVAGMYALSAQSANEPLVDDMIRLFMDRLAEVNTNNQACDLATWLQLYAFDVILQLTFSNTMGFLAKGGDVGHFLDTLNKTTRSANLASQSAILAWILRANPLRAFFRSDLNQFPAFIRQQVAEHAAKLAAEEADEKAGLRVDAADDKPVAVQDMLTRFMRVTKDKPDLTVSYALANVNAGSDTTAITLRSIFYFLLKHPRTMQTLMAELRAADLSYPVTWKESQTLPYLHAVVEEALRLHPAVGFNLERNVPEEGLVLDDGFTLQPGTTVSINAWVTNRDAAFGPHDTDDFVPERWLRGEGETQEVFEHRLAAMRRYLMSFGAGKRICLGRNISYLEIYKVVPTLLMRFDVALAKPEEEWSVTNQIFVKQSGMDCVLKERMGWEGGEFNEVKA